MGQEVFLRRVTKILDSHRFTNNGPFVEELEESVATNLNVSSCIAVSNATQGLQLLMTALGLTGEVIVPSWTFIATPHAARMAGLKIRFVDVNPTTHTIDIDHLSRLIHPDTAAVIGVHLFGQPCDIPALKELTSRFEVPLIFDAAHALGVRTSLGSIGSFGSAEVFSLHATKFVHGFEGGLITTDDNNLADELRLLRNFGFTHHDHVERIGTNAKLSEIHAAMALTQFETIELLRETNRARFTTFASTIDQIPGLTLFQPTAETRNDQYVVVDVDAATTNISRDDLISVLEAEGVLARRYFAPGCHRQIPYVLEQPGAGRWLPETNRLAERTLVLPTGPNLSINDVELIGDILESAVQIATNRDRIVIDLVSSK